MTLKAAWLEGSRIRKEEYRQLYSTGERLLSAAHSSTATPLTSSILSCLDVWRMRAARSENARTFMTLLDTSSTADTQNRLWAPLRHGARDDAAPFNVQLLCASESVRDALVQHMIRHRIYPAVHWRQRDTPVTSGDADAIDCAARIMTIPLDYRYSRTISIVSFGLYTYLGPRCCVRDICRSGRRLTDVVQLMNSKNFNPTFFRPRMPCGGLRS